MISLGPAKDALAKLKPPAPEAAYLNQAINLAKQGKMLNNPLDGPANKLKQMGLDKLSTALSKVPGGKHMVARLAQVTAKLDATSMMSKQMFGSVTPSKMALPSVLTKKLDPTARTKLENGGIPSITSIMSTASGEQALNEKMGTSGDNPCLPVQKTMEKTVESMQKLDQATNDPKLTEAVNQMKQASKPQMKASALEDFIETIDKVEAEYRATVQDAIDQFEMMFNEQTDLAKDELGEKLVDLVMARSKAFEQLDQARAYLDDACGDDNSGERLAIITASTDLSKDLSSRTTAISANFKNVDPKFSDLNDPVNKQLIALRTAIDGVPATDTTPEIPGIFDKLAKVVNAFKAALAANKATDDANLQAAIKSPSIGGMFNDAMAALNKGINGVADSMISAIQTVQAAEEKAMQAATAMFSKDLIATNPCMKSVLSPGVGAGKPGSLGVYEYKTKFQFRNAKGDELVDPALGEKFAGLLANSNNLKVNTILSSFGHETWNYSCTVVSTQGDTTIVECELTYTVDIDLALSKYVTFMDYPVTNLETKEVIRTEKETIDNISFLNFFDDGVKKGRILAQVRLQDCTTAPKLGTAGLNISEGLLVIIGDILWSGGKKPSLLTPEMQQMTEPPKEPMPDLPVTTEPEIVRTREEVEEEKKEETKEPEPVPVKEEPTKITKSEPVVARTPQQPFKKSLLMTKELTPNNAKWKDAHSVTTSSDGGKGSLMVVMMLRRDAPPEITYKYELDSWYIDQLIEQIMASSTRGTGGSIHFQNIKVIFYKKDGSEFGHGFFAFHLNYFAPSHQVSVQATYAAGEHDPYDFEWDSEVFKDDPA